MSREAVGVGDIPEYSHLAEGDFGVIRGKLFRLNRADTEWIEKAIEEDVRCGQLEKGTSDWGFPAFPTKEKPTYKAIQRGRRMVVDYRELNKVTVRKFFLPQVLSHSQF